MKKINGLLMAGIIFAGSLTAFAGCSDGTNVGKLNGNFTEEASAEQFSAVIENIDSEKVFGDATQEGWKLGLEVLTNFEYESKTTMATAGITYNASSSQKITMNYALSADNTAIAGKGELKLISSEKMNGVSAKSSTTLEAYNDANFIYLNGTTQDAAAKLKISLGNLFELVGNIPSLPPVEEEPDTSALLEELANRGAKIYIDQTNGLKFKFSFDEDYFKNISEDIPELGEYADILTFGKFTFDVYFAVDANGAFKQFSVDINIGATVSALEAEGMEMTISIKGGFALKAHNKTVTLPSGIADDSSYILYDPNGSYPDF